MDKIDAREDPLGHLMIDAPEYLVDLFWALSIAKHVASSSGKRIKVETPDAFTILRNDTLPGSIIGLVLGTASYIAGNFIKNWIANSLKS